MPENVGPIPAAPALKPSVPEKETPTIAVVGGSRMGKTTLIAKLARGKFQDGMLKFAGNGNTTSCKSIVTYCADALTASIYISEWKDLNEITIDVERHLKTALIPELKGSISSRPKEPEARKSFYLAAMEKRMAPAAQTFRVEKLLCDEPERTNYLQILASLLEIADKKADDSFRRNYFSLLSEDKSQANQLVEELVGQLFSDRSPAVAGLVGELTKLISDTALRVLSAAGFEKFPDQEGMRAVNQNEEQFNQCALATTNSKSYDAPSAACMIKKMSITVPSEIKRRDVMGRFRFIDVVGFDNDGHGKDVLLRANEALATDTYDIVLLVTSALATPTQNTEYLRAVQKSVRPSKMVVAVTHFDAVDIFQQDDDPDKAAVISAAETVKKETLTSISKELGSECRVKPPAKEDVICFANKRLNKLGDGAIEFFDVYMPCSKLIDRLGEAYKLVRRKITGHNIEPGQKRSFLRPKSELNQVMRQIRQKIEVNIMNEYSKLRDGSSRIHHWTVDAALWNFYFGREHRSQAYVWDNVVIHTFSDFVDVCAEFMIQPKFANGVNIPQSEDRARLLADFESNLRMHLRIVAKEFLLSETALSPDRPSSKERIKELAREPKYNKWSIFEDMLQCLMLQLGATEQLESMLQDAFDDAVELTYNRLLLV